MSAGRYKIPAPPKQNMTGGYNLVRIVLFPIATIFGYLVVPLLTGVSPRSPALLVPMLLTTLGSGGFAFYRLYKGRQDSKRQQTDYRRRLNEIRNEITASLAQQNQYLNYVHPSLNRLVDIATGSEGENHLQLWERRPEDSDFGELRIGHGERRSTTIYEYSESKDSTDSLNREATQLAKQSEVVLNAPVTIHLAANAHNEHLSIHNAIGICGVDSSTVYEYVHLLLTEYVTLHAPTDTSLLILGWESSQPRWESWANLLPHCRRFNNGKSLCFERQNDLSNPQSSEIKSFLKALQAELEGRAERGKDSAQKSGMHLPLLLLVVDLLPDMPDESFLHKLESEPALSLLMKDGGQLGAAVIFVTKSRNAVPSSCNGVIALETASRPDANELFIKYYSTYTDIDQLSASCRIHQRTGEILRAQIAEPISRLQIREPYGADIPSQFGLFEMLGVRDSGINGLREVCKTKWCETRKPAASDWLRAPVGMASGSELISLALSAKEDGVHGMVAGTTGAGKSELLTSFILSLAANTPPDLLNFVLVDFKGGGAFDPLRPLPHVVDVVTNLSKSDVDRMFNAIDAEMARRQRLNVETDSKDIVHYRKNGLHGYPYGQEVSVKGNNYTTAPFPHLFVIIDEFAEMIAIEPEYKARLESITRLGRSLGVSLMLAAQRPSGVTAQMQANIKFRICLRVETREESVEMLRRPDATYLPNGVPGRGYIKVGNEKFHLVQVAYSGGAYTGKRQDQSGRRIKWLNRKPRRSQSEDAPEVFEAVIAMMADLAKSNSWPQSKPWPDPLPNSAAPPNQELFSLESAIDIQYLPPEELRFLDETDIEDPKRRLLNKQIKHWLNGLDELTSYGWEHKLRMNPIIGLIDNPFQSSQSLLTLNFRRGNAVILSASGWGKTTSIMTVVTALVTTHSPNELHLYFVDFGGRQFAHMRDLPHTGAVIHPEEEERLTRLLRILGQTIDEREKILSQKGFSNIYAFNAAQDLKEQLPVWLVFIDNFAGFKELYEEEIENIVRLLRDGRAVGIHFLITADSVSSLTSKVFDLLVERIVLKVTDVEESKAIAGREALEIEDIPGRGYVRRGRRALQAQIALPLGVTTYDDERARLTRLIVAIRHKFDSPVSWYRRPEPIGKLPQSIVLEESLFAMSQRKMAISFGVGNSDLRPATIDLARLGPHFSIIGPPASGKTTLLRTIAISILHTFPPQKARIVMIDPTKRLFRAGNASLAILPHVVKAATTEEEILQAHAFLTREGSRLRHLDQPDCRLYVLIDNYLLDIPDEILARLADVARVSGRFGIHFIITSDSGDFAMDARYKRVFSKSKYGIALQDSQDIAKLGGDGRRENAYLNEGRGYLIKGPRYEVVQVASAGADGDLEARFAYWIDRIAARHELALCSTSEV